MTPPQPAAPRKAAMRSARSAMADALEALRPAGGGLEPRDARRRLRPLAERQQKMLGRQQRPQPLRPFDQADAFGQRVLNTQLPALLRRGQTVEVEMPDGRPAGEGVDLDQGEGRAGHFFVFRAKGADEGTGEGGLAAAEVAGQADDVAGARTGRQAPGEAGGGGLVRQIQGEGGGGAHAAISMPEGRRAATAERAQTASTLPLAAERNTASSAAM